MHFKGIWLSDKSVKNGGIKIVLHTYIENTKIKIICTFPVTSSITVVTKAVRTEELNVILSRIKLKLKLFFFSFFMLSKMAEINSNALKTIYQTYNVIHK